MSRTNKANPKDYNGGGCREYWSNRPHNKGGSAGIGKYQKNRTARTERRLAIKNQNLIMGQEDHEDSDGHFGFDETTFSNLKHVSIRYTGNTSGGTIGGQ